MNIALFGTGQMGHAIAHMIKKLGDHFITTFDIADPSPNLETDRHIKFRAVTIGNYNEPNFKSDETFDLIISSLPYNVSLPVAKAAIKSKILYCDLGGSVPTSNKINQIAEEHKATVFTDLGLAPGWANIMAEEAYHEMLETPIEVKIRCGGIPALKVPEAVDPFNYSPTWSVQGLYNEYVDDCEVLMDGEFKNVPPLKETEYIRIKSSKLESFTIEYLEAFTTSGGISHTLNLMKDRGVYNCSYKTLRYQGHRDFISYFLEQRKFNANQLGSLFRNDRKFDDVVIVDVEATSTNDKYRKTNLVRVRDGYSAMQRATSGGLVAAIFSCLEDNPNINNLNRPLGYQDVPVSLFNTLLNELEIHE